MASPTTVEIYPSLCDLFESSNENESIEIDDLDLSVLFPPEKATTSDFIPEVISVFVDMRKDREKTAEANIELARQLDEQEASSLALLAEKEEEMKRCLEDHRQKEENWQKQIDEMSSKVKSLESKNLCVATYVGNMIQSVNHTLDNAKKLFQQNEVNEAKDEAMPTVVLDDSDEDAQQDDEATREATMEIPPPAEIEHQKPSDAMEDDSVETEDESGNEKENVAPLDEIEIQPVDNVTIKPVRTVIWCKWCEIGISKKMWSAHKWDVHKVPPKDKAKKMERALKRKGNNDDDENQSESDVSVCSGGRPSKVPLRIQGINKPKKLKKMTTSSPV